MYKLIDSQSFFQEDEVTVTLLNLKDVEHSGLEKTAADDRIAVFVKNNLSPKDGKFYLHINAMGAGEYYGSNKNADYFPEEQLKQYHKTFEETGYVYRHHINKDPAKSMGRVIFSIYNERMHRVELIAEVDRFLGKDIYDRIQAGDFPQTSMACRTPYDVCSVCGNKAHTRQEYCVHLTSQLNRVLPDGRKVMALNLAPLRFFDISIVIKPADITSSVLQKVAYAGPESYLSVDAAIEEGLIEGAIEKKAEKIKQAALAKLSELVKVIDGGNVIDAAGSIKDILSKTKEPKEDLLDILSTVPLEDSLNALAEMGMSPSIAFLANLIVRKLHGGKVDPEFGRLVEETTIGVHPSELPVDSISILGDIDEKPANPHLLAAISKRADSSLFPDQIEKRAARYYEGSMDTTDWYLPHYDNRSKDQRARDRAILDARREEQLKSQHVLLGIGGAAVLAKMIIASLAKEKIENYIRHNVLKLEEDKLKYNSVTKTASVSDIMDRTVYYAFISGQRGNSR